MRLNFDQDTLQEAIVGYKLVREAFYKIPDFEIDVDELRVIFGSQDWLNDLCINIFKSLVVEDEDDITVNYDISEIKNILENEYYDEFIRDSCFEMYEEELEDEYKSKRFKCDICGQCDDCEELYEEYISEILEMGLYKRRLKLLEGVNTSKILDYSMDNVANVIEEDFIVENIISDITICESSGDIIIEYLHDKYIHHYDRYIRPGVKNAKMILDLMKDMEAIKDCKNL